MNKEQVNKIKEECLFPDTCENSSLIETHISWIVLTDQFAFKIKRPVRFSFVDFSTLEKRKHYCHLEVKLNSRLAPEMYLGVFPVTKKLFDPGVPDEENETIDYAIQMLRMDNEKEMDKLLKNNLVKETLLKRLAEVIARFHKKAKVIKDAFDTTGFQEEYADISTVLDVINEKIGKAWGDKILRCIEKSNSYLNAHRSLINERIINGFHRDCHGDLNASNIFLYEDPVIFDCIEFNKKYRHIDVLNEIAFLCVDLDFFNKKDLSTLFYKYYVEAFGEDQGDFSKGLFMYYKSYRANIRAKVTTISLSKAKDDSEKMDQIKKYIELMSEYCENIPKTETSH
jgi:uncharacterized protein